MFSKTIKSAAPYIFIIGVGVFMLRGIFAPGFMSGYDNSIHYYEAYFLTQELIPHHHWISGWSMQGLAGCPILLHHPQTGFLLMALLNKLLFLPLNLSYKILVLLSYISLGAGFYKISSYRFGSVSSLVCAACLMLQTDIYRDMILAGIWNNYLAMGVFFLFFHILDKNIDTLTMKRVVLLGVLLGLLIPTHLFVAIFAFIILFIYGVFYLVEMAKKEAFFKGLFLYILIPLIACASSSYYLYGFIAARTHLLKVPVSKDIATGLMWSMKSFFGPLEDGAGKIQNLMINVPIFIRIIFGFFGLYAYLIRGEGGIGMRRFLKAVFAFILISLLFFSDILANLFSWWREIPLVGNLWTNRFLVYIQLGMYLFAAYGIAGFFKRLKRRETAIILFSVLLLGSMVFNYACIAKGASATLEQSQEMAHVYKVWDWVNKNIPPGETRVVYQNTIGNMADPILSRSDVFALSGVFTKIPQIGVFLGATNFPQEEYLRTDSGKIFGKALREADDAYISGMMKRFNSGYIVSAEPLLEAKLKNSELFSEEVNFGLFRVFRLKDPGSGWVTFAKKSPQNHYAIEKFENDRVILKVNNLSEDNAMVLKVSYHPFWKACLNGVASNLDSDPYGLMRLRLPDKGSFSVEFKYN